MRAKLLSAMLGALASAAILAPSSLGDPIADALFGPGFVRAEVIVKRGTAIHSVRLDRGRIRSFDRASLVLREADGTLVTVAVTPATRFMLGAQRVRPNAVRRGLLATTRRIGEQPADLVQLTGR